MASTVKEAAEGKKDDETVSAPGPTIFAHCDNSKIGAVTVLENNVPADELEKRRGSRWAIMNVWRPLVRPVTREPLALLDSSTMDEEDLIGVMALFPEKKDAAFGKAYPKGRGYVLTLSTTILEMLLTFGCFPRFETSQIVSNDKHKWYYASKLRPDEALLFKQFDTKTDGRARQTAHTAFQSKDDHGPPRESM